MIRLILKHRLWVLFAMMGPSALVGCKEPVTSAAESTELASKRTEIASIQNVEMDGNTFVISGKNLDAVTQLKLVSATGETALQIQSKSGQILKAVPVSKLALVADVVYRLSVTSAHADPYTVPITVAVSLPGLTCSGAGLPVFMGYTGAVNANLGGLKGGNDLCDSAYPGSHWASLDEVMKLGAAYPWTQKIWLRDFSTEQAAGGNYVCRGFFYGGTALHNPCLGDSETTALTSQSGAPSLTTAGSQTYACCNAFRALACVK